LKCLRAELDAVKESVFFVRPFLSVNRISLPAEADPSGRIFANGYFFAGSDHRFEFLGHTKSAFSGIP